MKAVGENEEEEAEEEVAVGNSITICCRRGCLSHTNTQWKSTPVASW